MDNELLNTFSEFKFCDSKRVVSQEQLLLIGRRKNNSNYKFIGTGFFVTTNGIAITAGHVFKNYLAGKALLEDYFCTFPNEKSVPIKILNAFIESLSISRKFKKKQCK